MVEKINLDKYFAYCRYQKNLDEKTLKAYRIDLTQYLMYLGVESQGGSSRDIERYIESLVQQYKIPTVKRKCAAIKAYYNYLVYSEVMEQSPFSKLKIRIRQEILLPRTIPVNVIECILNAAYTALSDADTDTQRFYAVRNAALLELLFSSGVRVSELCHIELKHLDLQNKTLLIYGKGKKERQIYLSVEQVISVLGDYLKLRSLRSSPASYLFLNRDGHRLSEASVRRIINSYTALAQQGGHYTPHMFRHSFATYLWDQCGDIYEVKEILGHSSIKTTERYVHASYERQKQLLCASHPRDRMHIYIK